MLVRPWFAHPANVKASGSGDALLRPRPLRTGRARFPGTTAQASPMGGKCLRRRHGCAAFGGEPPLAVRVEEPVEGPVLAVDLLDDVLLAQYAPDGHEPLFPLVWAAWLVVGVEQKFPACGTAPVLGSQEPGGVLVRGRRLLLAPPFGPVSRQGGVIRTCCAVDRDMPADLRPGELGEVGAAVAVTEYPPVLPGLVELAEVPGRNPAPRLVRVRAPGPPLGAVPDVMVSAGEDPAGDHAPVVGRPAPHDGVEPEHHRGRVRSVQRAHVRGQPLPEPHDRLLAGGDEQLAVALPVD